MAKSITTQGYKKAIKEKLEIQERIIDQALGEVEEERIAAKNSPKKGSPERMKRASYLRTARSVQEVYAFIDKKEKEETEKNSKK